MYAAGGQWDQVSFIWYMMQERGICKEPGVSWIEISNKDHRFVGGDRFHPEAEKIYDVLNNLSKKRKAQGAQQATVEGAVKAGVAKIRVAIKARHPRVKLCRTKRGISRNLCIKF